MPHKEEPDENLAELARLLSIAKYGDEEIPPEHSIYALPSRLRLLSFSQASPFKAHVAEIRTTVGVPAAGISSFTIPDVDGMPVPWDKWRGRVIQADTLALQWLDVHRIKAMAKKLGLHPRDITIELWWGREFTKHMSEHERRQRALPSADNCAPGTPAWFVEFLRTPECLPQGVAIPYWLRIEPRTRKQAGRIPESPFDDFILRLAEVYRLPIIGPPDLTLYVLTGEPKCLAHDEPLECSIDVDRRGHFTITIKGDYHTTMTDMRWVMEHKLKPLLFDHLIARGHRSTRHQKGLPRRRSAFQLDSYLELYEILQSKGYSVDRLLDAASQLDAGEKLADALLENFISRNRLVLNRSRESLYEIVNQLRHLMEPDPAALAGDY